jgi:MoxR-like ATPase
MDISETSAACGDVLDTLRGAIIAEDAFFEDILLGLLSRGHVLIEDVPGTGKTLTARSMATALGLSFSRIQFTPDLLPSDVTGTTIYDEGTGEFEFSEGPIFANVVLADEINRAPPKTQAALLEAMEEEQVTVDGTTYELPSPFFLRTPSSSLVTSRCPKRNWTASASRPRWATPTPTAKSSC